MADDGFKTVIVSTDPAHSLGDALQMELKGGGLIPVRGAKRVLEEVVLVLVLVLILVVVVFGVLMFLRCVLIMVWGLLMFGVDAGFGCRCWGWC